MSSFLIKEGIVQYAEHATKLPVIVELGIRIRIMDKTGEEDEKIEILQKELTQLQTKNTK